MRADLKDERDVVFLTESGKLSYNTGAEKEMARSLYVTEFTVGTVKRSLEDERRLHCGWYLEGRQVDWTKSMDNLKSDEQKFEYNP